MNNLREVTREPFFLEKAGFVRRDEKTTDVVRRVWYEMTVEVVEVRLVLQVEFELAISDSPFVRTTDNFDYSFNGVYLKVEEISEQQEIPFDKANWFKHPRIPPLEGFMKDEPREIDRFELNVTTVTQLRSLCKMLGAKGCLD